MRMDNEVNNYNNLKRSWEAGERDVQLAMNLLDAYLKIVEMNYQNGFVKECGFVVSEYSFFSKLIGDCCNFLFYSFFPQKQIGIERNETKEEELFACRVESVEFGKFIKVEKKENKENKESKEDEEDEEPKLQLKYKCIKNELSHLALLFNKKSRYIKLIITNNNDTILSQYIDIYISYKERYVSNKKCNVCIFENYDSIIDDCGVIRLTLENDHTLDNFYQILYYFNRGQGIHGFDNIVKPCEASPKLWHLPPYFKFFKKLFSHLFDLETILLPKNFHGGGKSVVNHLLLIVSDFISKNVGSEDATAHARMCSLLFNSNKNLVKYATMSDKKYLMQQKKMIESECMIMKSNINGRYLLEQDLRWVEEIAEVREQGHYFVAKALTRFSAKWNKTESENGNGNELIVNTFDGIRTRDKKEIGNKRRLRASIMQCGFGQLFELVSICDKWDYYVSGTHLLKLIKKEIESNVDKRILNKLVDECDEKVLIDSGEKLGQLMKDESFNKMITEKDGKILSIMSKALARKNEFLAESPWIKHMYLFWVRLPKAIELFIYNDKLLSNMSASDNVYDALIVNVILNKSKNWRLNGESDECWQRLNSTNQDRIAQLSSNGSTNDCNDSNASKVDNDAWDF